MFGSPYNFFMRRRYTGIYWVSGLLLAAGTATGAEFTTSAQLREIRSDTVNSTTGYTCLAGMLPACPVDLGTTTLSDVNSAPDTAPWNATASTLGGQVSQNSILGSTQMIATGSSSASATAEVVVDPSYLLVLRKTNPSTANDFAATFDLDEASTFSFLASGQIVYPDPNFPLVWDASLTIEFSGPSGVVGALQAIVDVSCIPDAEMLCTVAPTPISLSGILPPGSYDLNIELVTEAEGSWLPSTGALGALASGSYEVSLQLTPVTGVPALSPRALLLLALGIGLASSLYFRARSKKDA